MALVGPELEGQGPPLPPRPERPVTIDPNLQVNYWRDTWREVSSDLPPRLQLGKRN